MRRLMLGIALAAGTLLFSGCGLLFVARSQPYAYHSSPAYCYDCHSWPSGVAYSQCGRYEIRVVSGGYYYRPLVHGRHEEFRYARFHESNHRADNHQKSERGRR